MTNRFAPDATFLTASWDRFTSLLASTGGVQLIGTPETVEALLARSLLQDFLDASEGIEPDLLRSVLVADARFKTAAQTLLDRTRVALFREHHRADHWWWRIEELALGQASEVLLDVADAAQLKGVHPHTVRAAIRSGSLPARRLGRGFLIQRRDLERWAPRPVGRPSRAVDEQRGDLSLEAFNTAMASRDFGSARKAAAEMRSAPTSARRCLAIAIDSYNAGGADEALEWVERALHGPLADSSRQSALAVKGLALIRLHRPREAVDVLRHVSAASELGCQGLVALAEALLDSRRASEARRVIARAVKSEPLTAQPRYLAARIEFHTGRLWEALEHVSIYRALAPDDAAGLTLLGSILGQLGDVTGDVSLYAKAARTFREAGREGGPTALTRLGVAEARLGHWKRSARIVARLTRSGLRTPAADVGTAALLAAMQQSAAELKSAIDEVSALVGDIPMVRLGRAALAAIDRRPHEVLSNFSVTAESIDQADWPQQLVYGMALLASGEAEAAVRVLRSAVDRMEGAGSPALVHARVLLGRAAEAANDHATAEAALTELAAAGDPIGQVAALATDIIRRQHKTLRAVDASYRVSLAVVLGGFGGGAHDAGRPWDAAHQAIPALLEQSVAPRVH